MDEMNAAVQEAGPAPSRRMYHNMVYNPGTGRILLFGGQAVHHWEMDLQDTWAYDPTNNSWQDLGLLEAGEVYGVAFDEAAGRAIMLNMEGETWAYDPAAGTWEQRNPAGAPSRRCGHRMVYDARAGKVILFGGFKCTGISDPLMNDTWAYDYQSDTWEEMSPQVSPPVRIYHGMVYQPDAGVTLVWGGRQEEGVEDTGVWAYDYMANTWTDRQPDGGPPKPYAYPALVYDPVSGKVIMFGGLELTSVFDGRLVDESWSYDYEDNSWVAIESDERPPGRSMHAMAFSLAAGRAILLGGETYKAYSGKLADDMWSFDPATNQWTSLPYAGRR